MATLISQIIEETLGETQLDKKIEADMLRQLERNRKQRRLDEQYRDKEAA